MVVHWETSLKSLYVRTVWIDGRRHAILSKDDPVANAICPIVTSVSRHSRGSTPESTISTTSSQYSDLTLNANPLNLSNIKSNYNNYYNKHEPQRKVDKNYSNFNLISNKKEDFAMHEKNPLSERVLQWLDLAGRDNLNLGIDNLELEEDLKKYNDNKNLCGNDNSASRRNSSNSDNIEYQRRSKRNAQKINKKKKNTNEYFGNETIRYNTSGYLFHGPMMSNDLLNYAKKSLNNPETESDEVRLPKTSIPSSIITFDNDESINKNKTESLNRRRPQTTNITHGRHKIIEEEESNDSSRKKQSVFSGKCFESQYLELVRKRISENHFNMRATRRQLHIFIPSLPKATICDSSASSVITIDE